MTRCGRAGEEFPMVLPVSRDDGGIMETVESACKVVLIVSVPFQPQRRALATTNTEGHQSPSRFSALQFFQARQNNTRSGCADRMTKGDSSAIHIQFFGGNFSNGALSSEKLSREGGRLRGLQNGERLRGESLVELNQ